MSPSDEADVSSHDKLSTGFFGGINGCSIGTMTVNFSGSFWNIKDTDWMNFFSFIPVHYK